MEEYDEYVQSLFNKSPHTVRGYVRDLGEFLSHFGISSLEDYKKISPKDIVKYQSELASHMKASSVNAKFRNLKVFANWLVEREYCQKSPFYKVRSLREEKVFRDTLTQDQIEKLINEEKISHNKATLIALALGLRRAEITTVKVCDIHDGYLVIHGKGKKDRIIPLSEEYEGFLRKYAKETGSEYLFCSRRGKGKISPQTVLDRLVKIEKNSDVADFEAMTIRPHSLRRSLATNLTDKGIPVPVIQDIMGHSSPTTTARYIQRISSDAKRKALYG